MDKVGKQTNLMVLINFKFVIQIMLPGAYKTLKKS